VCHGSISETILEGDLLSLIICRLLSCVDEGVADYVWPPTNPEAAHTIPRYCLLVAVQSSLVWLFLQGEHPLGLKANFDHVCRARYRDSDAPGDQPCAYLLQGRCILTRFQVPADFAADRDVEPVANAVEQALPLHPGGQPIEQDAWAFFSGHFGDSLEHTTILGDLARLDLLKLEPHLGRVEAHRACLSRDACN